MPRWDDGLKFHPQGHAQGLDTLHAHFHHACLCDHAFENTSYADYNELSETVNSTGTAAGVIDRGKALWPSVFTGGSISNSVFPNLKPESLGPKAPGFFVKVSVAILVVFLRIHSTLATTVSQKSINQVYVIPANPRSCPGRRRNPVLF
jgi:hypothetical protein